MHHSYINFLHISFSLLIKKIHGCNESVVFRWDISSMDGLPNYMKLIYISVLKVLEEVEEDMTKEGRLYTLKYYIKEV